MNQIPKSLITAGIIVIVVYPLAAGSIRVFQPGMSPSQRCSGA